MSPPRLPPEEISKLMRFVAEKSKDATTPMSIWSICRQFNSEMGLSMNLSTLQSRIHGYRERISEMNEFDMDTKARMMMAVGATVGDDFLADLRKEAVVAIDDQNRIIRYGKKHKVSSRRSESPSRKRARVATSEVSEYEDRGYSMWSDGVFEAEDDYELPVKEHREEYITEDVEEEEAFPIHPDASEDSSTSVKDLLILLQGAVLSVDSARLMDIVEKMKVKIRKSGDENKQFPLDNINIPFDACLFSLSSSAVQNCPPHQECISLRDFLISLKSVTSHIDHQSINAYHQKLRTLIRNLSAKDKQIPVENVQNAIEATLLIIAP